MQVGSSQSQTKSFHTLCREAKKRLSSGFWAEREKEKEILTQAEESPESTSFFAERVRRLMKEEENDTEEMRFRAKVEEVLDNEDSIYNPLKLLMDETAMSKMTYDAQQRYILELSRRYLSVRQDIIMQRRGETHLADGADGEQ